MATITLSEYAIATLTDSMVKRTRLPWQFVSAQCSGPDFTVICSFKMEMEIGPDDAEFRNTITVNAQCDSKFGIDKLYGINIEGDGVFDALQMLSMMSTNTTNPE